MVDKIHLTDYQLALPQGLDGFPTYLAAYRKARRDGSFIILDNGAAEGLVYDSATLHAYAANLMANEIVVPDVLGDAPATFALAETFAGTISEKFNYMGVVQGANVDELIWIVQQYSQMSWITTLGIPRHLLTSMQGLIGARARVVVAKYLHDTFPGRFKVHLLGTNPAHITEVWDYRNEFSLYGVRGVDTSAPFNYAFANQPMQANVNVDRPANYFSLTADKFDPAYLELNFLRLKKAAEG